MTVAVCTDNERINEDIKLFNQALSDDDEMIGERLQMNVDSTPLIPIQ